MPSSGVWHRVDVVDWTDVSEDIIASIFRLEKSEDRGDKILRNVGSIDHIYTVPHPRRRQSS
jgi:hypothetical protein